MKKKMSNLSNLPLQKGQVISYLPVPLFFWRGKKGCYLSWKLKAFCKWMVGILVSLWDFEWILPIFRGELLVSREKNRVRFHRGSIHPLTSRMLGWTEYDQKRARASGGILVGVKSFWWWSSSNDLFKGESCYLLNAFMKLVLLGLNDLWCCHGSQWSLWYWCFHETCVLSFYSLSLHKAWYETWQRVLTCFFYSINDYLLE